MGSSNIDNWCEYAMLLSAPSGHSLTRFLKPKCTRLFTHESTKVKSDPTGAQFRVGGGAPPGGSPASGCLEQLLNRPRHRVRHRPVTAGSVDVPILWRAHVRRPPPDSPPPPYSSAPPSPPPSPHTLTS